MDAAPTLSPEWQAIIRRMAKRLHATLPAGSGADLDDLAQEGWLGYERARQRWRADGGASLKTFARSHIRGAMLDYLRECDHVPRLERQRIRAGLAVERFVNSLQEELWKTDRGPIARDSILGVEAATVSRVERQDLVAWILQGVNPWDRQLLHDYYLLGLNMRTIARRLGCSESRVSQRHAIVLERLRERMANHRWGGRAAS